MAPVLQTFLRSFDLNLEEPVRQHLRNVYASVAMSTVSAAMGVYVNIYTQMVSAGLLTVLGSLGLLLLLLTTPDNGKNRHLRLGYLLGFAFFVGVGMGPLLEGVIELDPSIIVTALLGTTVVFTSLSASALFATRGSWLYLGGTLSSLLSAMMLMAVLNLFWGSMLLYQAHLYLGLLVMCGFVLYDTQVIIEKHRAGDKDFVAHSVDLFIDFVSIFRRLLVVLAQNASSNERQKKKQRN